MSGRASDSFWLSGSPPFLTIIGLFGFRTACFTSGGGFGEGWKAGSFRLLRLCVGFSLFDSSAKVEAAGFVFNARRLAGMWNSNFNFEELLSIFFVSTTFTSLKALLVNVFVCRSNHSGLVGMSVIFETMIPPSLTPLQSSLSPFFSTFNLCFSSLAGDSKLSAFETIPFSLILFCPCLSWSRSSFDFIIGSISCPLFCPISESVFSFKPLPDRPFLFFFFLSLRSFDLVKRYMKKMAWCWKHSKVYVEWLKEQKSCIFNQLGDNIFKFVSIPHRCEKCVFTKWNGTQSWSLSWNGRNLTENKKEENQYILDISRPTLAYVSFYLFTVSIDRR